MANRQLRMFDRREAPSAMAEGNWKALPKKARKKIKKWERRRLVRRRQLLTIVSAWVITVPASAVLAGSLFLVLTKVFGD